MFRKQWDMKEESGRNVKQQTETCLLTEQGGSLALTQLCDRLLRLLRVLITHLRVSPLPTSYIISSSYFSGLHLFYQLSSLLSPLSWTPPLPLRDCPWSNLSGGSQTCSSMPPLSKKSKKVHDHLQTLDHFLCIIIIWTNLKLPEAVSEILCVVTRLLICSFRIKSDNGSFFQH